ncbi:serine/threonine kinase-like domain-containing protein STKLD1 [Haliotis rubra]|uniref:serine/threonine kinase-like domain-containing protein STKLD1 n=1 Tax=Haliotis rubra TaxID=36100 RepID=UPI001EE5757F|nr:serine/threonine kinase-like domain-containing protein STKLD1 [Haliotis rubra]
MENYRILERIGKGGQGSVHLVDHNEDGIKSVLKKVECHDESEANKAFKEAMALRQLQHPYVCGYKEFFVMWDKEESSMFVCIVMDYYSKGDLKKIIQQYQKNKQPMEEEVLKRYLGEILEALIFVHRKGVIHRDLKPSNIFIQDNDSICLGDFGVATIMGDAKTCTRNTVGTTNYMAPEIQNNPYDERSDVWALGCILFEMTTTAMFDGVMVATKLKEVKDDPGVLEEIFEDVAKHFSGDLITAIRLMLKYNPSRRPTAEQLVEKCAYIRKCVEARDSSMMEKRIRQAQTEEEKVADPLTSESPGILVVLEHIAKMIDNEDCVKDGMEHLVELTKQDGVLLEDNSKRLVAAAMKNNINNKTIQIAGCNVFNNVIVSAQTGDVLFTPEIISVIILSMKTHSSCSELQQTAAAILMALSADNRWSHGELIGSLGHSLSCLACRTLGVIDQILCAMKTHIESSVSVHLAELCATCCMSAIWKRHLTVNENNLQTAFDSQAIETICSAMKTHPTSQELAEAACAALFSLCLDEKSFAVVNDLDTVGILLSAVETHDKSAKVVKNACMALSGLVEPDEECAYRVLTSEGGSDAAESKDGIPIIMRAYELHKDNADVVESIVTLFMELVEYDDMNAEMRHLAVGSHILLPVHKRFRDNRDIMKPCEAAMVKLGVNKPL